MERAQDGSLVNDWYKILSLEMGMSLTFLLELYLSINQKHLAANNNTISQLNRLRDIN